MSEQRNANKTCHLYTRIGKLVFRVPQPPDETLSAAMRRRYQ